ncbi:hypothetical protein LTR17_000086 [Elasticomyces elasticus]|nr:hypothetical protein LTR17_000086 [Elasticomyces elasticus]
MSSSELTTELQSLGLLYVNGAMPTVSIKIGNKPVEVATLLAKHADTMTHLSKLGVQDVRLFFFNQKTKKPRHFFTGTVSISGSEIRMYFDDHAAENLLSRAQYTGSGTGFFKILMERGEKVPKHNFKATPALSCHPADAPTSDDSRLLRLPKELRDDISRRCIGTTQEPEFNGYPPPKPFDKIFGTSLPHGLNPLRATRRTGIALVNKQLQLECRQLCENIDASEFTGGPRFVMSVTSAICPMVIIGALEDYKQELEDVAKELDEYDIPFGLDLVIWHPASSKMCVGCLIDQVLVAADEFTSTQSSLPNVRILALQKFDVQGGSSSNVYRMMQLHLGGKVTLQSIIRPGITAWRSLIEPDFSSQTLMRRLLLDKTTSPVISAAEAEVISCELWAQPEAPGGAWSQMLTGVQGKLGSLLSGKATPK